MRAAALVVALLSLVSIEIGAESYNYKASPSISNTVRGVSSSRQAPSGYVTLSKDGNSFERDGVRFYSIGINCINIKDGDPLIPGDKIYDKSNLGEAGFSKYVGEVFKDLGFNTVGAFSSDFLAKDFLYTKCIYFGNYSKDSLHMLCDVFDDSYRANVEEYAEKECVPNDKNLLIYYISNEISIFGSKPWKNFDENNLINTYKKLPINAPGRIVLDQFLNDNKNKNLTYYEINNRWAAIIMEQYMKVCSESIKKFDNNHLIGGTRFASYVDDSIIKAVAKYSDLLSFNLYDNDFSLLDRAHEISGKGVLITEFSWTSIENKSGNPNLNGPNVLVNTDKDRANNYKKYLEKVMSRPWLLGICWFQFYDEPSAGRNDGFSESEALGLFSTSGEIYEDLAAQMRESNYIWGSKVK